MLAMQNLNKPEPNSPFPVVAIGADEGGLDAFKKMLPHIPENTGMAFLLLQHLAQSDESLLATFLSSGSLLAVETIGQETTISPDRIYILPEHLMLNQEDGRFIVRPQEIYKEEFPIDEFLKSIATLHKGFARGVVLSGNGSDGALGLKAIQEYGGATFVQNPESASFDLMPLNAIRSAAADFVLEPEEIPAQLLQLDRAYSKNFAYSDYDRDLFQTENDVYKRLIGLLRERTGHDFSHYKQPTIRRRIARRMVVAKIHDPEAYLHLVKNDVKEQIQLFNDILIPVSYFFRDSKVFDVLLETAFPQLFEEKVDGDTIRIWVAGCSTGEEAYSLAIGLHEFIQAQNRNIKIQLFASDISENVIAKARTGIYSWQEVQNISEARLRDYFLKIDGTYHVKKEIRDMCIFAIHNFIKDPPFAKMDLISCRNVLIYLDPYLQKKALATFHYALKPKGILFLGKSESIGQAFGLFEPLVKNFKIFSRRTPQDQLTPRALHRSSENATIESQNELAKEVVTTDFQKTVDRLLFNKYMPAGVIINDQKEIIHFYGNTGPFLLAPPGKPNFNIFRMVREGLAFEVRSALLEAKVSNEMVIKRAIPIKGLDYFADIEVMPLEDMRSELTFLLIFTKSVSILGEKKELTGKKSAEQKRIQQLEAEIEQLREDIRKVTEDQEVANEELQSANEELLSNGEELQTLNEQLENSAEELQSNNKELLTVNEELIDRQEQLVLSRLYAETIIENIREPLVIIDNMLRVRSANASFYSNFATAESEVEGKIIFDTPLGKGNFPEFKSQIIKAYEEGKNLDNIEINVLGRDNEIRVMMLNMRPISNEKLGETLMMIAIEDITELLAANKILRESNFELEENNKQLASFSSIASHDLQEPLRKIHLFCSMIFEDDSFSLSEDAKQYLSRIMVSASRMQELIDNLLLYSEVNSFREEDFLKTDMVQLFTDAIAELDEKISSKNARIDVEPLPDLPLIAPLVKQVFNNLVGNSLKYTQESIAPIITVVSAVADSLEIKKFGGNPDGRYYKITVSDNGIGFKQDQSERIFEPFIRLHSKEHYSGSGIGLSICKKIMTRHGGDIVARAELENGASFDLYFPADQATLIKNSNF